MGDLRIKICGLQTPELARAAVQAGAHFIGLVFHPASRRAVTREIATQISAAVREQGGVPVAVFVNQTAREMRIITDATQIEVVQLHGNTAREQHVFLPAHYQRMYVQDVATNGLVELKAAHGCDPMRDYLLFDNAKAGKGVPFDWDGFSYSGPFRIGFAGGLSPLNVAQAIARFQPAFVDVSGGVENDLGEKDLRLIQQFIHACDIGERHDN